MTTSNKNIINCDRGFTAKLNTQNEYHYTPQEGCCKLKVYDWLKDIPKDHMYDIFEIRFKNTHKGFYRNVYNLPLVKGDIVAVESASGHDIGIVSACGPIVLLQMKRYNTREDQEPKKIYRKAKPTDIEKWQEAIGREHKTMIKTRQIATQLNLNMKVGDVEFQGDGTKATFYYIADERVDFRELIKVLADEFKIRIEMRQIGARQEAGLIGGIGVCGRELCCAQWIADFMSVNTTSARLQELSLNPQKLAGQCSKLKCCLNYEVATYINTQKDFPQVKNPLETIEGPAYWQKTDVLKKMMWFSFDPHSAINLIAIPIERVKEIIALNQQGKKVDCLVEDNDITTPSSATTDFISSAGEDSITRFDKTKKHSGRNTRRRNRQQTQDQAKGQKTEQSQGTNQDSNQAQSQQKDKDKRQHGYRHKQRPHNKRNNKKRNNETDKK
jgi:cell fate regulator YaaT (PSP1 superfamily)